MKILNTKNAPAAIGPYSQAIIVNGMLFSSGQIPLDPKTRMLVEGIYRNRRNVLYKYQSGARGSGNRLFPT